MFAWTCLVSVTSLHCTHLLERFLPEGLRMSLLEFSLAGFCLHDSYWCIVWHDYVFTWLLSCLIFRDCIASINWIDLIHVSSHTVMDFPIAMQGMNLYQIGFYHFTRAHPCSDPIADDQAATCLSRFGFLVFWGVFPTSRRMVCPKNTRPMHVSGGLSWPRSTWSLLRLCRLTRLSCPPWTWCIYFCHCTLVIDFTWACCVGDFRGARR